MTLPPGPRAPGALQSLRYGLDPYGFFGAAHRRYGDVFTVKVTGQTWVVLARPDLVKETFARGPEEADSGVANEPLKPLIGRRNVLLLDGEEHLRHRKLVLPPFHGDRMRAYAPVVADAARRQFAAWPRERPVSVLAGMQSLTLDVILRAVFGVEDAARMERLRTNVQRVQGWLTGVRAALVFTFLGSDRLAAMRAFRRHLTAVDEDVFAEIAVRRADPEVGERADVLSMLLATGALSDRELRDELVTLLVAGHETTAALLAWAVHELARAPEAVERLAREEDGWADAVVNETLRLHPPVPLVVRRLRAAASVDGFDLDGGVTIAPCSVLVHRREDVWRAPREFRPERFLGTRPPPGAWLPFGGGVRRCLGAAFASFEARGVLTEMARTFTWRPAGRRREWVGRRGMCSCRRAAAAWSSARGRDAQRPRRVPLRRIRDPSAAGRRLPRSVPPTGPTLRPWQRRALDAMAGWEEGSFLVSAAPGAGKTIPALVFARQELRAGRARRVAVICPTTPLTRQWAQAAARLGLHLLPDAPGLRPPGDFQGVSLTYARVAMTAADYARSCGPGTLVIADEAHHLGEDLAWGESFRVAFGKAKRWLLLSGTPFRSDQSPIPGVRYEGGVAVPDVSYTYADAVRDGVCRQVAFVPYDGTLQWQSGDDVIETSFGEVLTTREAGRRYRTAISTELPDGLPRILRAAHAKLLEIRSGGHRDAAGLVVTADSEHARAVAGALKAITGAAPTVVLHTEASAHRKLDAFRRGRAPWIVAVNMVSEGVDIPRLRVGVYATVAKTPLIFRQIVGRFVRVIPGRPVERSHVFLPADGNLRALAAVVETELRHVLHPPAEAAAGLLDDAALERAERTETEPTETPFVPLAADVAPQLALFGGGSPAPTPIIASRPARDPSEDDPPEPVSGPSNFERRATLRAERHRLVSELRRLDGRSHREINAWVNKATKVQRVEDATIDQLQRSIELLVETLRKASTRRRTPARA